MVQCPRKVESSDSIIRTEFDCSSGGLCSLVVVAGSVFRSCQGPMGAPEVGLLLDTDLRIADGLTASRQRCADRCPKATQPRALPSGPGTSGKRSRQLRPGCKGRQKSSRTQS